MTRSPHDKPESTARQEPRQRRGIETRARLLDVAGRLLGEIGIERISTNLICEHAGVTPPAFYRYFQDKYDILRALGMRLMDRQNLALATWAERYAHADLATLGDHIEELVRATAEVTASEPGAIWIQRALRAVPQLTDIRVESHRAVADHLAEAYGHLLPHLDQATIWSRLRLLVEMGYAVDEMLVEETRLSREDAIRQAAQMMRGILNNS